MIISKTYFKFGLLIIIFFILNNCKSPQTVTVKAVEEIPYFTFYKLDYHRFIKNDFDTKRTKFILYFNSECDHCQKQAKWLKKGMLKNPAPFRNLEMVFVSFEEMKMIEAFRDKYQFTQNNITFLQDSRLTFTDKFGVSTFPSILIYSKEGKLIKKFEGETKVEDFLPFL